MKKLLSLLTILIIFFLSTSPAHATYATIFSDNFEDNNDTGWTTNYVCGWATGVYSGHMQGSYGMSLGGDSTYGPSYIEKTLDLSSYNLVEVTYYGDTDSMDSTGEKGYFKFDGLTIASHYNDGYAQHSHTIDPASLSISNTIRFELVGSGCGDYFYIDEIVVKEASVYSGNCYPPISGSMTLTQSCSFANASDGVATSLDSITISSGTLTINPAQDIYAGTFELTGGSIALSGTMHPGSGKP